MSKEAESTEIAAAVEPRDQVIAWLLEGHRDADIRQAVKARWPGKDAKRLMTSAVEHYAQAAECDLTVVVGWALEAYRDLYRRMLGIGDYANAMKAVKEMVTLAGKYKHVRDQEDAPQNSDAIETHAEEAGD